MKKCTCCNIVKDLKCFNKNKKSKDGLRNNCNDCRKLESRVHYLANKENINKKTTNYRNNNKEYYKKYNKRYRISNFKKLKEYQKEYYNDIEKKQHKKTSDKIYRDSHKEKLASYKKIWEKIKYKEDIQFKLRTILRHRLMGALRGNFKSGSAIKDLGCTIQELKQHLESKFQSGMTWENHSQYGWHIDHLIPLSSFDLTNREEFLKACHYTNLQPLWAQENLSKGSKIL